MTIKSDLAPIVLKIDLTITPILHEQSLAERNELLYNGSKMLKALKEWWLTFILGCLLLLLIVLRWQIATLKIFDADELAHLHTAWLVTHGSLPYKDFFTGYPPTFYLLLAPLTSLLPPSDFLPVLVRQIFFLIFLGSMFLFYRLARMVLSREFSLITLILISSSVFFIERGVEIRPDLLVIFLWLLSIFLLSRKKRKYFFAGAASGLMATLTQKSIYPLTAMLILLTFAAWTSALGVSPAKKIITFFKYLLRFGCGFLVFPLLVFLYIWQNNLVGYLPDFLIKYPLVVGQGYHWENPWYHLGFIANFTQYNYFYYFYKGSHLWLRTSEVVWTLAIFSTGFWLLRNLYLAKRPGGILKKEKVFFLTALGLSLFFSVAYLLTISMKIPQYWLIPTPFVMLSLVLGLSELSFMGRYLKSAILILAIFSLSLVTLDLWNAWTKDLKNNNNFRQRENIRAVLVTTKSTDKGYDGIGSFIFRHDCFYFGMSIPQEIPKAIFQDIIESFTEGKCDFVLKGPFNHMIDWNTDQNWYVQTHFTPLISSPDLLIENK